MFARLDPDTRGALQDALGPILPVIGPAVKGAAVGALLGTALVADRMRTCINDPSWCRSIPQELYLLGQGVVVVVALGGAVGAACGAGEVVCGWVFQASKEAVRVFRQVMVGVNEREFLRDMPLGLRRRRWRLLDV